MKTAAIIIFGILTSLFGAVVWDIFKGNWQLASPDRWIFLILLLGGVVFVGVVAFGPELWTGGERS
jgi:H+/Cl- antiporter ClcA